MVAELFGRNLIGGGEQRHGEREVEARAGLAEIGRCQVCGQPLQRELELRVQERRPHPFAGLPHRRVWKADDGERGEPATDVDLDGHLDAVDPVDRECGDAGEHPDDATKRQRTGLLAPLHVCSRSVNSGLLARRAAPVYAPLSQNDTRRNPNDPRLPGVSRDQRRSIGHRGERLAGAHLTRAGYEVLARNFRTAAGELDLVAAHSGFIVFCEVRTRIGTSRRTPHEPGGALESIGPDKRRQLRRMAREWLTSQNRVQRRDHDGIRFDAIGVVLAPDGGLLALEHVENAF